MNKTLLFIGLFLAGLAIALPLMNVIPAVMALAVGIPGATLILIASLFGRSEIHPKAEMQVIQTIVSTDKKLQAIIKQRPDGKYLVETWKMVDYIQDSGPGWARQGAWGITDTLSDAVDIAKNYVRN
jgi:hypothetical protein